MTHFAFVCPPFFSHLRVFEALAAALKTRGHRATLIANAGAARLAGGIEGLDVAELPATGGRELSAEAVVRRAARPNGLLGVLRTVADMAAMTEALCRDGPALLARIGAEALVGDQMEPAAGLMAAHLKLPFASVACALPIDPAPGVPLPYLGWRFDASDWGLQRNRGGEMVAARLLGRQRRAIETWAGRFGLAGFSRAEDCLSPTLRLAQTVPGFDFPRPHSQNFAAVGPIRRSGGAARALPFEPSPGRPLVFASLGTLQGHRIEIFRAVASACREMDVDLLIAHCGGLDERQAASLPARFVADFVPQEAALARASVCVTHGGLNTVLDSLRAGVPALAIPIAFDQKGVAARLVHHGAGRALGRRALRPRAVRAALEDLLAAPAYRDRAAVLGAEIAASGGAEAAADRLHALVSGAR